MLYQACIDLAQEEVAVIEEGYDRLRPLVEGERLPVTTALKVWQVIIENGAPVEWARAFIGGQGKDDDSRLSHR